MTPGELLAVLDALPGVQVETHWPIPEGEFDPLKVFVALRVDGVPMDERSEDDGDSDRRDLPTHR